MGKAQTGLRVALKIPKRKGILLFNCGDARSVILFAYQLNRSPEGNLELVEDRNNITL